MGSAFWLVWRHFPKICLGTFCILAAASGANGSVITSFGTSFSEDFDTLANTGTSSTLPTGWFFSESDTNADTTYAAGTGSSNAGNTYSFGANGSTERAFGMLLSGSLTSTIGASFTNATGGTITSLLISYVGEQWRLGATGRNDRLDFEYSFNATGLADGTWTGVDLLDFIAPKSTAPTGELDGNATDNRTAISSTISSLSIPNGSTFWIRWTDSNASGADDGLAVDDFSLTANGTLPPTGVVPEASAFLVWSLLCGSVLMGWKRVRDF